MAAADRKDKGAARGNGRSGLGGDDRSRFSGDCVGICKHFDFHEMVSDPGLARHDLDFFTSIDFR
jgi:hypothetical protein